MDGLKFSYKEKDGRLEEIKLQKPQHIFLEPYGKVVLRYYFKKNGIEEEETNITRQIVDTKYLSVKVLPTKSVFLSKLADFDNLVSEPLSSFPINFEGKEDLFVDVLYESLTSRRLKVKVSIALEEQESFENEYTISDGPDEYVKMTDVQIKYDGVYFNYIYRRSGRLKKYPSMATYHQLADIYKDREFTGLTHVDFDYSRQFITEALNEEGYTINSSDKTISKKVEGRDIEITDDELAEIIKKSAKPTELLNLLKTRDLAQSKHPLRKTAEYFLQDCDKVCGLPDANTHNIVDGRT